VRAALHSLQLLPRGPDGWASPELLFGALTTLVSGPLGSGKTPVLKALAYAIGGPAELPPDVRRRCSSVQVKFRSDSGDEYVLRRAIEGAVDVEVVAPDASTDRFQDERSLSEWVLQRLGIPPRQLVGLNGDATIPYLAVLGPAFIVDQDVGWSAPYVPHEQHKFVRDQRQEIWRLLLGVPQKNAVSPRSSLDEAAAELEALEYAVSARRRGVERLTREVGDDVRAEALDELSARYETLKRQMLDATNVVEGLYREESILDLQIRECAERRDALRNQLSTLQRRRAQLVGVEGEVLAEVEALEQNEVAAQAFRSLCASDACQFFRQPEDSYGRRVLYLKDQLKDFSSGSHQIARELLRVETELANEERQIQNLLELKKASLQETAGGEAVAGIQAVSIQLSDVSVRLDRLRRINEERRQLAELIERMFRMQERVAELKPSRGRRDNSRLLDARAHLAKSFNEWIVALKTPNVAADARVDDQLRVWLGAEKFDSKISHSGSTRTKLVLAFHAALLEACLAMQGAYPHLLILDAPRQHELTSSDVRAFVQNFRAMAQRFNSRVQLVLSATDIDVVEQGDGVVIWRPAFEVDDGYRYLGPPDAEKKAD
jgi:hypothetical protein